MKHFLSLVLFLFIETSVWSQNSYEEAIKQGDSALAKLQFPTAINKYFAAEAFNPSMKDSVKAKLTITFLEIERLRVDAINQKNIARKNAIEAETQSALARLNSRNAEKREMEAAGIVLSFLKDNPGFLVDSVNHPLAKKIKEFDDGVPLQLGSVDEEYWTAIDTSSFFKNINAPRMRNRFKGEGVGQWFALKKLEGEGVTKFQEFLLRQGFLFGLNDEGKGIFEYRTYAAARLWYEYMRTVEKTTDLNAGVADGAFGLYARYHMLRWNYDSIPKPWNGISAENPTEEYVIWLSRLNSIKYSLLNNPDPVSKLIENLEIPTDTRKIADWDFSKNKVHLIGIRRNADVSIVKRPADDIFILLFNGLVYKFWGSTDPSAHMASRKDEAFLSQGQHKYHFHWIKSGQEKVYRTLRPYRNGVMIFRDKNNDNALTHADFELGLDPRPIPTILIHWSGFGSSAWSAGSQVIAGKSYINPNNDLIDYSNTTARNYSTLGGSSNKGAYSVFIDLITALSKEDDFYYTLLDESLFNSPETTEITAILNKLKEEPVKEVTAKKVNANQSEIASDVKASIKNNAKVIIDDEISGNNEVNAEQIDIASRVKAIVIDKLGVDKKEVVAKASFANDLGADSLDIVELVMEFEKEFNIQIPDDQAEKLTTVGKVITYVEGGNGQADIDIVIAPVVKTNVVDQPRVEENDVVSEANYSNDWIAPLVKTIIVDTRRVEENDVVAEANLINDLGVKDKSGVSRLMHKILREFALPIEGTTWGHMETVGDLITYIEVEYSRSDISLEIKDFLLEEKHWSADMIVPETLMGENTKLLIKEISEKFEVEIPDSIQTLGQLIAHIEKLKSKD